MAANQGQPPQLDDAQEEERLENQMEHMKELHLKLRNLRDAIPRMLAPLTTKHDSPKEKLEAFKKTTDSTRQEIQDFRKSFTSPQTQAIFRSCQESRRAKKRGVEPWRARDDPEWTTLKKQKQSEMGNDDE